jgi:hypothetical protein
VTDEPHAQLCVLNGRDVDLATDANRVSNRCRDALTAVFPALERGSGTGSAKWVSGTCRPRWSTPTALAAAGNTPAAVQGIGKRSPRIAAKAAHAVTAALASQTVTDLDRIFDRCAELGDEIEQVHFNTLSPRSW